MDETLRVAVWERAGSACEYCRLPQALVRLRHQIDHIIAQQHRGPTEFHNLALTCLHCNKHKGPNISGIDPETGALTRLFHPRVDNWEEHFEWAGTILFGRTAIGRTTTAVLAINDAASIGLREDLADEGRFPY